MMFQEQCAYFIYLNLFNLSIKLKYTVENIKPMLEVPNMYVEENLSGGHLDLHLPVSHII